MSATLTVRDETTFAFGGEERLVTLGCPTERASMWELICARVCREVQEYNVRRGELLHSLVQLTDADRAVNDFKTTK